MNEPQNASQLQKFVCVTNWMRNSISQLSKAIKLLRDLLEECCKTSGSRNKRGLEKVSLHGLWGTTHSLRFEEIKNQIAHSVKLSHFKEGYTPCLFTDASDE